MEYSAVEGGRLVHPRARVHRGAIGALERGRRASPHPETLAGWHRPRTEFISSAAPWKRLGEGTKTVSSVRLSSGAAAQEGRSHTAGALEVLLDQHGRALRIAGFRGTNDLLVLVDRRGKTLNRSVDGQEA